MSYDIWIGNVVLNGDYESWRPYVENIEHPDAPEWPSGDGTWPDISGKTNGRHPGYGGMDVWAREVGLHDFWFDKDTGVLAQHPGCIVLRPHHLERLREARMAYQARHPDASPGWTDRDIDCALARLIWYEWWMDWALRECERPGVENY